MLHLNLTLLAEFFKDSKVNEEHVPANPNHASGEEMAQSYLPNEQSLLLDQVSKALFKEPENPVFYYEKAALLHSRGYWVDSISLLDKALAYADSIGFGFLCFVGLFLGLIPS